MKKFLYFITGVTIILIAPISWKAVTFSQANLPYPEIKPDSSPNGVSACTQSVANEITIMRNDWITNLKDNLDQEKPTSELVDGAFDSLRTYRCWLDYLCEAVYISSVAKKPGDVTQTEDPTTTQLNDQIVFSILEKAGCADAENVEIPGTEIKFMPYCIAGNVDETLSNVTKNYSNCRQLIGFEFGEVASNSQDSRLSKKEMNESLQGRAPRALAAESAGIGSGTLSQKEIDRVKKRSTAFVLLERTLRTKAAEKKSVAMQNKLSSILTKMNSMEAHVDLFKQYLNTFDLKLPCYAENCD